MVINRHGKFFLRAILADDVAVEELLDLGRAGKPFRRRRGLLALFIFQNGLADADAFVADVRAGIVRRRTDQLFDLFLRLMAEGTAQGLVLVAFFHWCEGLVSARLRRSLYHILGRFFSRKKRKPHALLTFWNRRR